MKSLTEKTLVPVSLVICIIGGMLWLTQLYAKTQENSDLLIRLENKQDEYNRDLKKISNHLSRIEGKLGIDIREDH